MRSDSRLMIYLRELPGLQIAITKDAACVTNLTKASVTAKQTRKDPGRRWPRSPALISLELCLEDEEAQPVKEPSDSQPWRDAKPLSITLRQGGVRFAKRVSVGHRLASGVCGCRHRCGDSGH